MNSTEIFCCIEQIASVSGKNDKQALLAKFLDDEEFFNVVFMALDPFTTFGIRPSRVEGSRNGRNWDRNTLDILYSLKARSLSGNAAYETVSFEMTALNKESSELLWRVLNKDLKAGFSESSVNKVKKGSFKDFPYMRCSLPKDAKLNEWPWSEGIFSQIKADGRFTNVTIEDGYVEMTTRQGQRMPNGPYVDIIIDIAQLYLGESKQLHGELLVMDSDGNILPREIGNGMLNKVDQGGEFAPGCYPALQVWDVIPLDAVHNAKKGCSVPYINRLRALKGFTDALHLKTVSVVETRLVRSIEEAYSHYAEKLKEGKEGTIIKMPSMIWKDGTSKGQVKLKLEVPCELEIVGFEPGKEGAKTEKTFGSLRLRSADGLLEVNCSGFTDALRQEIHENRESWMNTIVTVTSNGIMWSVTEGKPHSLFLPRFTEHRLDKTVADDMQQIEAQFANAINKVEDLSA